MSINYEKYKFHYAFFSSLTQNTDSVSQSTTVPVKFSRKRKFDEELDIETQIKFFIIFIVRHVDNFFFLTKIGKYIKADK
jgi:hypothetical protein